MMTTLLILFGVLFTKTFASEERSVLIRSPIVKTSRQINPELPEQVQGGYPVVPPQSGGKRDNKDRTSESHESSSSEEDEHNSLLEELLVDNFTSQHENSRNFTPHPTVVTLIHPIKQIRFHPVEYPISRYKLYGKPSPVVRPSPPYYPTEFPVVTQPILPSSPFYPTEMPVLPPPPVLKPAPSYPVEPPVYSLPVKQPVPPPVPPPVQPHPIKLPAPSYPVEPPVPPPVQPLPIKLPVPSYPVEPPVPPPVQPLPIKLPVPSYPVEPPVQPNPTVHPPVLPPVHPPVHPPLTKPLKLSLYPSEPEITGKQIVEPKIDCCPSNGPSSHYPDGYGIPGIAGIDYPNYNKVPLINFQCSNVQYPGYYGIVEAQCQVFVICQADGRQDSFLCPNGTMFHQKYFVCDWWYHVDCSESPNFYHLNSEIGKVTKHEEKPSSNYY